MFNIDKAHMILDEMIMNGQIVETNKNRVLAPVAVLEKASKWTYNNFDLVFVLCHCLLPTS